MQIVKVSVTQDASISRQKAQERVDILFPGETLSSYKTPSDAIRSALSHVCIPWASFEAYDAKRGMLVCKLRNISPTKLQRGVVASTLYLETTDAEGHTEVADLCAVKYNDKHGYSWKQEESARTYQYLIDALMLPHLDSYGQQTLFTFDVRRAFAALTSEALYKIWVGGVYVCLDLDDYSRVLDAAACFDDLDSGALTTNTLDIEPTEANRLAIAHSLAEDIFIPAFESLTTKIRAGRTRPDRLEKEYSAIIAKLRRAESRLDLPLAVKHVAQRCEQALSALFPH